jgi:hypothetical protein
VDDVGAFLRLVGYGVLKLASVGRYHSRPDGLLLEGCIGMAVVASSFFALSRFVL